MRSANHMCEGSGHRERSQGLAPLAFRVDCCVSFTNDPTYGIDFNDPLSYSLNKNPPPCPIPSPPPPGGAQEAPCRPAPSPPHH